MEHPFPQLTAHLIGYHREHMPTLPRQAFLDGFLKLMLEPERHININPVLELLGPVLVVILLLLEVLNLLLQLACSLCVLCHVQLLRIEAITALHHFLSSIFELLAQSAGFDAHAFTFNHFLWQLITHPCNIVDAGVQTGRFCDGLLQVLFHGAAQVQDHFLHHRLERDRRFSICIKLFLVVFYLQYSAVQLKHLIAKLMLGLF